MKVIVNKNNYDTVLDLKKNCYLDTCLEYNDLCCGSIYFIDL